MATSLKVSEFPILHPVQILIHAALDPKHRLVGVRRVRYQPLLMAVDQ
jgi:hypothetical protein